MSDFTTTPEWRVLLAAIRANPADDLPQLMAADWLEEHGKCERAVFIRNHVEVNRLLGERSEVIDRTQLMPDELMSRATAFTSDISENGLDERLANLAASNQLAWHRGSSGKLLARLQNGLAVGVINHCASVGGSCRIANVRSVRGQGRQRASARRSWPRILFTG